MRIRPRGAADHDRPPCPEQVRNLAARVPALLARLPPRARAATTIAVPLVLVLAVSGVASAEGDSRPTETRWISSTSQVAGQQSPSTAPGTPDNGPDAPSGTASRPGRPGANAGSP